MIETGYKDKNMQFEPNHIGRTAQVVYEALSALRAFGQEPARFRWANAEQYEKARLLLAITYIVTSRFTAEPVQVHELMCKSLYDAGWSFGFEEDPEAMTHPDMVPFAELSEYQHTKLLLMMTLVETIWLDITGLRVLPPVDIPRPLVDKNRADPSWGAGQPVTDQERKGALAAVPPVQGTAPEVDPRQLTIEMPVALGQIERVIPD